MSPFSESGLYLGVPSVYKEKVSRIYGIVKREKRSLITRITESPIIFYTLNVIHLNKSPLNKAATLRIPASTWKKMDSKYNETKKQQREKMKALLKVENGNFSIRCFKPPVNSKIVSKFASPRTLPNGKSYYHTGVDLRAYTGTPIRSTANGTVVLAEHMIVPGNVVVIDHGGGVYSRYMHLDKFKVKVGDYIQQGQLVGLAGGTGRVEAPHLHWEIVWKRRKADPHRFIASMNNHCLN